MKRLAMPFDPQSMMILGPHGLFAGKPRLSGEHLRHRHGLKFEQGECSGKEGYSDESERRVTDVENVFVQVVELRAISNKDMFVRRLGWGCIRV